MKDVLQIIAVAITAWVLMDFVQYAIKSPQKTETQILVEPPKDELGFQIWQGYLWEHNIKRHLPILSITRLDNHKETATYEVQMKDFQFMWCVKHSYKAIPFKRPAYPGRVFAALGKDIRGQQIYINDQEGALSIMPDSLKLYPLDVK